MFLRIRSENKNLLLLSLLGIIIIIIISFSLWRCCTISLFQSMKWNASHNKTSHSENKLQFGSITNHWNFLFSHVFNINLQNLTAEFPKHLHFSKSPFQGRRYETEIYIKFFFLISKGCHSFRDRKHEFWICKRRLYYITQVYDLSDSRFHR